MAKSSSKKTNSTGRGKTGRTSSSGGTSSRKPSARKYTAAEKKSIDAQKSFYRTEIAAVVTAALGIFLLLTDLGLMGSLGAFFLGIQKGLFGQAFFLTAVSIVCAAAVSIRYRDSYFAGLKVACVFGALIVISAVFQLLFAQGGSASASNAGPVELYRLGAEGESGGGAVGGMITNTLTTVIGRAGTYLVLIALLIVFVVIITEKSFVSAARFGAEKTAGAVRSGAGMTIDAARSGRERYQRIHKENVIRREARREEERLRKLEETFGPTDTGRRMSMSDIRFSDDGDRAEDTKAAASGSRDPGVSADFGRDIIDGTQNKAGSLRGSDQPAVREDYGRDRTPGGFGLDPAAGDTERRSAADLTGRNPVVIRQIDYDSDEIPFEETVDETYRSYSYILDGDTISIDTARDAGFAVSRNAGEEIPERPVHTEPEHIAAFMPADGTAAVPDPELFILHPEIGPGTEEEPEAFEPYLSENGDFSDIYGPEDDAVPAAGDPFGYPDENDGMTAVFDGNDEVVPDTDAVMDEPMPEEYYTTASGKTMKAPDSYEAGRILNEKRGNASGTAPASGKAAEPAGASSVSQQPAGTAQTAAAQAAGKTQPRPKPKPRPKPYRFPSIELLDRGEGGGISNKDALWKNGRRLEEALQSFGVEARVSNVVEGPRVSRYELIPAIGVRVNKITSLKDDIKMYLEAPEIRIEAPIPGKKAVGIEVPNDKSRTVKFREILESQEMKNSRSKLAWGLGLDIGGRTIVGDITRMPHVLVAGTTGSGKSVGINSLIMSVLYRATPDEVRMILVDPKQVEFSMYNGIPHLLTEVVTSPEKALSALNWAVAEMNRRYKLFQESGTKNITGYNEKIEKVMNDIPPEERPQKLPYILIVIDELSELMMHAKKDVEGCIVSLAQLARAAGIHLVVATQRPSVDVVTGLLKSNIPARVAFRLPSQMDSRTILDTGGAENLLGNGDMLYKPGDRSPIRVQGAFLSDEEVERVVKSVREKNPAQTDGEIDSAIARQLETLYSGQPGPQAKDDGPEYDEYFAEAGRLIISTQKASIGGLQRKFKIGFNRAARIMDQLYEAGVVSGGEGTKERQVLMDMAAFEELTAGR